MKTWKLLFPVLAMAFLIACGGGEAENNNSNDDMEHHDHEDHDHHDHDHDGDDHDHDHDEADSDAVDLGRKLTATDLEGKDVDELRIMRNTYYAQYGYKFKSEDLREYFADKYEAKYDNVEDKLSDTDRYNVQLILATEKKRKGTSDSKALSIKDFKVSSEVPDDFLKFMEKLINDAQSGDESSVEYAINPLAKKQTTVDAWGLYSVVGSKEESGDDYTVVYEIASCEGENCGMMCGEEFNIDASSKVYDVSVTWEYPDDYAGRGGSMMMISFKKEDDGYKAFCTMAAG